jgi:hypothetical protein
MIFRTLLLCFFVIMLTGCNGPAEDAGEDLDEKIAGNSNEVANSR